MKILTVLKKNRKQTLQTGTLTNLLGNGFIQGANYPVLASAPVAVEVPKAVT